MRYELKTVLKKDATVFYKKDEDVKVVYMCMSENGLTNFADRDWVMNHLLDIDNVRYTKNGKIYPCKSKQGVVLRYLIDQMKSAMRTGCYDPVNLIRLSPTYFTRDNQGIYHLKNSQFSLEHAAKIEEGMKKKEFKIGKNIDCVVALLKRYGGMNTDNYRKYNVNYNTFDFLLFIALEEEIQEGRFIMMVIDHQTNKRVFYSRKNIEENQIIFDTLYREAEKQGSFLDGAHAMKQNGLGTMQANFSHSMYFNGIEIGENIG